MASRNATPMYQLPPGCEMLVTPARSTRRTLHAAVRGPFGADYLALAALRTRSDHARIAIVLLVNRATALLDPAHVRVRMRSARALGAPTVAVMSNPFADSPATAPEPVAIQ